MIQFYHDNYPYEGQADSELDSCPLPGIITHRKKIHLDDELSEKYLVLQKALGDAAKVFLSQKLLDSNELIRNRAFQSKEFMDALEILSSNKELLVNLIQDQNSTLLRHIQDIQHALGSELLEGTSTSEKIEDSVSSDLLPKQNHHKIFRKKDKLKGSDISQDRSQIVLLEPSPVKVENDSVTQILSSSPLSHHCLKQEEGLRAKSYFSIKGIKRRWGRVMGENKKEKHPISMDKLLDKISYGFKDSVEKKREKPKLNIEHPQHGDFANEYLNEMLTVRDETDSSPTVSKSLERVVSLRECHLLSPRFSQENSEELLLSPQKIIFSSSQQVNGEIPVDHLSPLSQNLDQDAKMLETELNQECVADDLKLKGGIKIVETSDIKLLEEHDDLDVLSESIGNEPGVMCEVCEAEGSSAFGELKTADDKPLLVIPSLSISPGILHVENSENSDCILEKPDRPSPVSVLEPFFLEDTISPGSTTANHVVLALQHQQIDFQDHIHSTIVLTAQDSEDQPSTCFDEKKAIFGYVTTLLQSSGTNHSQILETHSSSYQFLDSSVLEEVGTMFSLSPDDAMLLFDCTNEVLAEIKERLFCCTSWVHIIKPSSQVILRGPDFIQEVCKGIDRHLQLSELEGRSWMDLWSEIEETVFEMADIILDEIIEENMA
ncbi:uncharacterized protein LOC109827255 isoform X2 [Asparagus officinalis]|uniref:uncharacterized protein LOC109827255 isoform X2 n=1 Tax=Asparagus officinalis TaxID=4686 RepID=UPI00098E5A9D|nr:uncharacterized protein LOC109827255 isoform X2 [Asparagus officinalis]